MCSPDDVIAFEGRLDKRSVIQICPSASIGMCGYSKTTIHEVVAAGYKASENAHRSTNPDVISRKVTSGDGGGGGDGSGGGCVCVGGGSHIAISFYMLTREKYLMPPSLS